MTIYCPTNDFDARCAAELLDGDVVTVTQEDGNWDWDMNDLANGDTFIGLGITMTQINEIVSLIGAPGEITIIDRKLADVDPELIVGEKLQRPKVVGLMPEKIGEGLVHACQHLRYHREDRTDEPFADPAVTMCMGAIAKNTTVVQIYQEVFPAIPDLSSDAELMAQRLDTLNQVLSWAEKRCADSLGTRNIPPFGEIHYGRIETLARGLIEPLCAGLVENGSQGVFWTGPSTAIVVGTPEFHGKISQMLGGRIGDVGKNHVTVVLSDSGATIQAIAHRVALMELLGA